jgi:hypothetical protein
MSRLFDRAGMSTATTGTGTLTLGSALGNVSPNLAGFLSFAGAGVTDGLDVSYLILDANNGWEVGHGTYTASGTTLTRNVTKSSNAGSAISLSGNAQVFITIRAEDLLQTDASGNITQAVSITNATMSTSSATGALVVTGGIGSGNQISAAKAVASASDPTTNTPSFDASSSTVTVANGSNVGLWNGFSPEGLVLIKGGPTPGAILCLVAGGGIVFQTQVQSEWEMSLTTTPGAGKSSVGYSSGFRLYNNTGAQRTYSILWLKL